MIVWITSNRGNTWFHVHYMKFPVRPRLENILPQIFGYPILLSPITLKRVIGNYVCMKDVLLQPLCKMKDISLTMWEIILCILQKDMFFLHWLSCVLISLANGITRFPLTSYNCPDVLIHTRITYPNLQQWVRKCNWRLITEVMWIFLVSQIKDLILWCLVQS